MSEQEIKVSVVVTAYNIESYLPRCLDSLLAQTFSPIEFIVVDDGSTDKTAALCDEYAAREPKIKVLHKENGGPSSARNAGIAIAQGDFIGYVDGDDWVDPTMYQEMYEACIRDKADIAICSYLQEGEGAEVHHPTGDYLKLSREEALELYIMGDEQYHIYHSVWSKLFCRRIAEAIKFPEGHKSEDIMYTTWAMSNAASCVFIDKGFYHYTYDRRDSIMHVNLQQRRFDDEIPFWKEQMGYLYGLGMRELADKASYQFDRRMLDYFIDFRKRKMRLSARQIIQILRDDKRKINTIYQKPYVPTGDRVRMRVALALPGLYYVLVRLYDRFVIPLRQ